MATASIHNGFGRVARRLVALGMAALGITSALALVVPAPPAAAICPPGEDCVPAGDPIFVRPANGFTWSMPSRFTGTVASFHWLADDEVYEPGWIHPTSWDAKFFGCASAEDSDAAATGSTMDNTYTWAVDGAAIPQQSCSITHPFPRQGTYKVSLTVSGPQGGGPFTQDVTIRDILIVSIGDSYASGEGNPDVPRNGDQPAKWVDRRCHRSANSGPAQAARQLEFSDPHTSVTFLSFACSGATITTPDYDHSDDPGAFSEAWYDPFRRLPDDYQLDRGTGILGPYVGVEPPEPMNYGNKVRGQLDQLRAAVGERRIDALLVSGGGNDVGFGYLIEACLVQWDCSTDEHLVTSAFGGPKVPVRTRFQQGRDDLGWKYDVLARELRDLQTPSNVPIRIARTYITEYPDPTTQLQNGNVVLCDEIVEDIGWLIGADIAGNELVWAHQGITPESYDYDGILPGLNREVALAAGRNGWVLVDHIAAGFAGHGYCVGDSDKYPNDDRWFRTAAESAALQGPTDDRRKTRGTMHPTTRGLRFQAERLLQYVRPDIAALPVDVGVTELALNDVRLAEGNSGTKQATFTITRSGRLGGASSVQWSTANSTALAGTDYVAVAPTTVSFAASETTKTVSVTVNGDTTAEADETFSVKLTSPGGATIADDTGVGTITNDDTNFSIADVSVTEGNSGTKLATFAVKRLGVTSGTGSVNWATADGTAVAGSDYTSASGGVSFGSGEASKSVSVTMVGDTTVEPNETFKVALSTPVGGTISRGTALGTIQNDDNPSLAINDVRITEGNSGAAVATFTITRSGGTSGTSSVRWATSNVTAAAGSDYASVTGATMTFAAGDTAKTVSVTVYGDAALEGNEAFNVQLSSPIGATIADGTGVGTIVDDDAALAINDVSVTEGDWGTKAVTFTVTRSGVTTGVSSVHWATADDTAQAGSDYAGVGPTTLAFAAGETSKSISVNVYGDYDWEPAERFLVRLTSPSNATLADDTGVGTIGNDDVHYIEPECNPLCP